MKNIRIIDFAKSFGYDGAMYRGKWKQYYVYEPTTKDTSPLDVGKPEFIFVSGDRVFMAPEKDVFDYIDSLPEE